MSDKKILIDDEAVQVDINAYDSISTDDEMKVIIDHRETHKRKVPEFNSRLRGRLITVPEEIYRATGIKIFGQRIKSLIFSTDLAIIRNTDAQAVIAVYPFTPTSIINKGIIETASVPAFVGVGGGITTGKRSVKMAFDAEMMGAYGVVVNAPMKPDVISDIVDAIDIPLIATISSEKEDYLAKLEAGAAILNVSGGPNTHRIVDEIRKEVGASVPIIATGGPSSDSILKTIEAGANAITYTPPTTSGIFAEVMKEYRKKEGRL